MGKQQGHDKPLHERIKERFKHLIDEVVGTLEGLLSPPPAPVPIRSKYRRR